MALPTFSGRPKAGVSRRPGNVYTQAAPDLAAMEANVASRIGPTKRPRGWSQGKAPWKTGASAVPPGIAKAKARHAERMKTRKAGGLA